VEEEREKQRAGELITTLLSSPLQTNTLLISFIFYDGSETVEKGKGSLG
jgi:hypothetical protein